MVRRKSAEFWIRLCEHAQGARAEILGRVWLEWVRPPGVQIQRGPELDCEHTVWGREGWWKCLEAADGGLGVAELRAGPGLGQGPSFPVSCSLSHKATC